MKTKIDKADAKKEPVFGRENNVIQSGNKWIELGVALGLSAW